LKGLFILYKHGKYGTIFYKLYEVLGLGKGIFRPPFILMNKIFLTMNDVTQQP
jgi:hypothetical protein